MNQHTPNSHAASQNGLTPVQLPDAALDGPFADLARLAAVACGAPYAVIGFVHGEQEEIVASHGTLPLPPERSPGLCSLAVQRDTFLMVEDTRADGSAAFAAVPHGAAVRSCAAWPVRAGDGAAIGAVCVMDEVPRAFDLDVRASLSTIARQVSTHVELWNRTAAFENMTQRLVEAEDAIRQMAMHDALTGLPGRLLYFDRLEHALSHASRYDETVAVMFLDLDGFKMVNDTYGHPTGDMLLQSVSRQLKAALRRSDTVARVGGDEFAIVCPDLHAPDDAGMVAEKLLAAVRDCRLSDGRSVTASIGIAMYPYDGATGETLLCDADAAMYRAKRRGRNQYAMGAIVGRKGSP